MKTFLILIFFSLMPFLTNAQGIGTLVEDKDPIEFPDNSLGVDLMFSEGGFGLGGFYRRQLNNNFTVFADLSFSEAKEDNEFEYYDYWTGQSVIIGKKNRVFLLPINLGVQYRIFNEVIHDNLRPYLNFGVGPTILVTTPYEREFFSSFGKAQAHYAAGGYFGLGANFGLDKTSLIGLNLRYYIVHIWGDGIESLAGRTRNNFGGFYLTLNFGFMY
jgi:hypothetical protein